MSNARATNGRSLNIFEGSPRETRIGGPAREYSRAVSSQVRTAELATGNWGKRPSADVVQQLVDSGQRGDWDLREADV